MQIVVKYPIVKIAKAPGQCIILNNIPKTISADYTKLKQVFQNLITNAIKFHKKGELPQIDISCEDQNDFWKFSDC